MNHIETANKGDNMKLLTQNSKMKKSGDNNIMVFNFGITAVKACPFAGDCKIGCYATQGAYNFSNARLAFDRRYELTKDTELFSKLMIAEINTKLKTATKRNKRLYIIIHDGGDFYSRGYLQTWLGIIIQFPMVTFYAYTKSIVYFKDLIPPANFKVIYSLGGKLDNMIDISIDRHAKVFQTEAELIDAGYINAGDNDLLALTDNKRVGLVYHGTKSYSNTSWDKVA